MCLSKMVTMKKSPSLVAFALILKTLLTFCIKKKKSSLIFTAWKCSFESGLCGAVNEVGDKFDWSLNSGSTISSGTGPSGDHTTGQGRIASSKGLLTLILAKSIDVFFAFKGRYLYTEATFRNPGDKARLWLAPFNTTRSFCVTFYYHMWGAGMGSLGVRVDGLLLWNLTGNRGNTWQMAVIPVQTHGYGTHEVRLKKVYRSFRKPWKLHGG